MSLASFRSAIGLSLDIEEVLIQRVNHKASAKIILNSTFAFALKIHYGISTVQKHDTRKQSTGESRWAYSGNVKIKSNWRYVAWWLASAEWCDKLINKHDGIQTISAHPVIHLQWFVIYVSVKAYFVLIAGNNVLVY